MDNLSNLNNKKIEILQFPRGGDLGISEGEIIKIDKNEIYNNKNLILAKLKSNNKN